MSCRALSWVIAVTALTLGFTGAASATTVQKVVSPGGIEALLVESHNVPLVSMSIGFKGGASQDPGDKRGVSRFVENMFFDGSGRRSSLDYLRDWNRLGASGNISTSDDWMTVTFQSISANLDPSFELLRQALIEPDYDGDSIERTRGSMLATLSANLKDPDTAGAQAWYSAAYGDTSYGLPTRGSLETVTAIGRADIEAYRTKVLTRDNMKIGVTGDIDAKRLGALLDTVFGALPAKGELRPTARIAAGKAAKKEINQSVDQALIFFGNDASEIVDPNGTEYYAAILLNFILAGGDFTSRMTKEVREKRGLAYSVSASYSLMLSGGNWYGSLGTRNETVDEALRVVTDEITKMAKDGPTDEEIASAKDYFSGSFFLDLDTNLKIAGTLRSMQQWGLGMDYIDAYPSKIQALTAADVRAVAKKVLKPDDLIVVVVRKRVG